MRGSLRDLVDCIPLNPDYRESREELLEKYRRITGETA
jgi:hypothetical protein